MCEQCGIPAEDVAGAISMGLADEANYRDRINEQRVRLMCLDLAVKVKGGPRVVNGETKAASSADVLASASAYYDFVMGKNNRKNDNDPSVSR